MSIDLLVKTLKTDILNKRHCKCKTIMNYLFFLTHPSKYHLFKHTINRLIKEGHFVKVAYITKDVLEELIVKENWDSVNIFPSGRKRKYLPRIFVAAVTFLITVIRLQKLLRKRKYYKLVTDDALVINGYLSKISSYFFLDNDYSTLSYAKFLLRFTDYIFAPMATDCGKYEHKKIGFKGVKPLAHLHPIYFRPDTVPIKDCIDLSTPFFLIRLSKLDAAHDVDNQGINDDDLAKLIETLSEYGNIYISNQREIMQEFRKYKLQCDVSRISDVIYHSSMIITDSGTMATEGAILGVPNLLLNNLVDKIGVHKELKEKKIQYCFNTFEELFIYLKQILDKKEFKANFKRRVDAYIERCDDLNEVFFENLL